MTKKVCPECEGTLGKTGLTGYTIFNAYTDEETFITCEFCGGTGEMNSSITELSLSDFNLLNREDYGNA